MSLMGVMMWFCPLPFLKIVQIKVYFVKEFYYLFNNFLKGSVLHHGTTYMAGFFLHG